MKTQIVDYRDMKVGKPYLLPHGVGTLIGYEVFDEYGSNPTVIRENPITEEGRKVFMLHEGHSWYQDSDYYAFPTDIQAVH